MIMPYTAAARPRCGRFGNRRTRGVAMVSAVMILLIVAVVAAVLLSVKSTTVSAQKVEIRRLRAEAAAMAATQLTLWRLGNDVDLETALTRVACEGDTSFDETPLFQFTGDLAGATFVVDVWPGADTVRLKSSAVSGGAYFERWAQIRLSNLMPWATVAASEGINIENNGQVDSFDSRLGPYGGGNVAAEAVMSTNSINNNKIRLRHDAVVNGDLSAGPGANTSAVIKIQNNAVVTGDIATLDEVVPIPTLSAPSGTGPDLGDLNVSTGTLVWASDRHYQELNVSGDAILEISGDITVYCEGDVEFADSARLRVLPNSSLTLYATERVRFRHDALANVYAADPSKLKIYMLGTDDHLDLMDNAQVYAIGVNPGGQLHVKGGADFHGIFAGKEIHIHETGAVHQDLALTGCQPSP